MSAEVLFYNALGILGSIFLLFGFYRVNNGRWTNKSVWYELDNVIGAAFIIAYQVYYHAYVSVIVNIVWAGVAVIGLGVFFRRLHGHQQKRRRRTAKVRS